MSHISFSELKMWSECPFKRKLVYGDRVKGFQGNLYTAFGEAIHSACEKVDTTISNMEIIFLNEYEKELESLPEEVRENISQKDAESFLEQGIEIIQEVPDALSSYFEDGYKIVAVEEKLFEPIKEFIDETYSFKGFMDMVVETPDGTRHIIDWKSCSWGWDARRRSDPMALYQLVFYKHYYALKYGIAPENIVVHFGLLKRTAKVGSKAEIFKVTSGKKRTENALKLLKQALYNISKDRNFKNKTFCNKCEFHKTEHCP